MAPPSRGKRPSTALAEPEKKERMKPADEISAKLMWDPHHDATKVVVGYEDRFLGIVTLPLQSFVADDTGIPFHRVRFFRDEYRILWDRQLRYDGSSTLHDPMRYALNYSDLPVASVYRAEDVDASKYVGGVDENNETAANNNSKHGANKQRGASSSSNSKREQMQQRRLVQKASLLRSSAEAKLEDELLTQIRHQQYIYRCMLEDLLEPESPRRRRRIALQLGGNVVVDPIDHVEEAEDVQKDTEEEEEEEEEEKITMESFHTGAGTSDAQTGISSMDVTAATAVSTGFASSSSDNSDNVGNPPCSEEARTEKETDLSAWDRVLLDQILSRYWANLRI